MMTVEMKSILRKKMHHQFQFQRVQNPLSLKEQRRAKLTKKMRTMMRKKKKRTPNLKEKPSNLRTNSEVFLERELQSQIKTSQRMKNLIKIVREIFSNPRQH
jgi:hypothetical protein